ncbi:MAG: glycerol-3-phosphate dehydrogenase [Chitinophagaceae bacterium]|nr:MAG: glycerol-3-phosphate dehydrogenase [Chitinophagaceae bacterium]
MQPLRQITVIGGGSWATALVKIFSESDITVYWYLRSQQQVDYLLENGRNSNYLSFLQLNLNRIKPTCNLEEAINASDDILFAVPSAYLGSEVSGIEEDILEGKQIYVSIKGIVPEHDCIPSEFLARHFGINISDIIVLAGPCHAEEIAMDRKTFLTVAGFNSDLVKRLISAVNSPYLKVIANNDPLGVEYAAILKNVIGISCGIIKGMNYGDNFLAVVVSNSLREVSAFLAATDNQKRDVFDSGYFGDLLVTAYSEFSRNRTFGQMIGRGYSIPMAEGRMNMVAEGFPAVKGIYRMARQMEVNMPIVSATYRILYKQASPYHEFKLLENSLR